jgi:hypothetical protein
MTSTTTTIPPIYSPDLCAEVIDCAHRSALEIIARDASRPTSARADFATHTPLLYQCVRGTMGRSLVPRDVERPTLDDESISEGIVRALNGRPAPMERESSETDWSDARASLIATRAQRDEDARHLSAMEARVHNALAVLERHRASGYPSALSMAEDLSQALEG